MAAGFMCLFLSGEVCLRLYKQTKKVLDPDLDNIANPHEVKHWMDPRSEMSEIKSVTKKIMQYANFILKSKDI